METAMEKQELFTQVNEIEEKDFVRIIMPHIHYVAQCLTVTLQMMKYREKLVKEHMDFSMLDKMNELTTECRAVLSEFNMVDFPNRESKIEFQKSKDEAENLLYELITTFNFAFREHPDLLAKVSFIRQGASNADMIQDLSDCHVLGTENKTLLEKIHYDMHNVEYAKELATKLALLHAQATVDKTESPELTRNRNRWFTLLKKTIDEAMCHARYIYRDDQAVAETFKIKAPPKRNYGKKESAEESSEA